MIVGRRGALACAGCLCLSLLGWAERAARAVPFSATLEYTARPGCPDATELKAIVTSRLGYDPFTENASNHVLMRISARGASLDGSIEWRDSTGSWAGDQMFSRVSGDCLSLVRAMGLAVAVQIQLLATAREAADDHAASDPASRSPAQTASTAPRDEPPAVTKTSSPPPPPPLIATTPPAATAPSRAVFAVGAGPSLGFGLSSAPVLLGRVFGAVAWPRISLELAAEVSLPATPRRADGAGIRQQYLLLNAAVCTPLRRNATRRWNACLLADAGEVRMVGEIDRPTSARLPFVDVGVRAGVIQPLGARIFLSAHADGLVILTRWTGTLDKVAVWSPPRFGAALAVAGGVRFP